MLYDRISKDDRISHFFKNVDMVKQRKYQADFLTVATGGPNIYEGMDMKEAHKKLGIKKLEFDAAW